MKRWAVFWACLSVVPISFDSPQDTAPIDIHAQRPVAPAGSSERAGSPDDLPDAADASVGPNDSIRSRQTDAGR